MTIKQPFEAFVFTYDFTTLMAGDSITSISQVGYVAADNALVNQQQSFQATKALVKWAAGTGGLSYSTFVRVATALGNQYEIDGLIEVRDIILTPGVPMQARRPQGLSRLSVCNQALAELPDAPIAALDEKSLQARECGRVYDACLAGLLEAHEWSFANKRVVLAALANDRPNEWLYAYALPTDMGTPRSVLPPNGTIPLPWAYLQNNYLTESGILYTNQAMAVLDYGASSVAESVMPAKFVRALVLDIASRIAMPLIKNREIKGDLIKQFEVEKERAIAIDMNRQPQGYPPYIGEAEYARAGYGGYDLRGGDWWVGYNQDLSLTDIDGSVIIDG